METYKSIDKIKLQIDHMIVEADKIKSTSKDKEGEKFWKGYNMACKEVIQFLNELIIFK